MKKFKLIDSDYDFRIYQRDIVGRVTYPRWQILARARRKLSFDTHCGCEHDCCGHLCAQSASIAVTSYGMTITIKQSFNY